MTSRTTGQPVAVGDLLNDFNFNRSPLPPLILPTRIPVGFRGVLAQETSFHFPLSWSPVTTGPVVGYNVKRSTTSGTGYVNVPGCSGTLQAPFTGTSCTDASAIAGTTYYYVVTSLAPDGTESPKSTEIDITP